MAFFKGGDFLGLQQSLCNINFSFRIFYEQISKKKFAKMHHGDYRISQSGRFWWPLFDSNFYTVNVFFGWNQLYQKNFTSFGNQMSKKFCNYLWRFWCTKKQTLSPGQRFFSRSTLFNKQFLPETSNMAIGERNRSFDIIKWSYFFDKNNRSRDILKWPKLKDLDGTFVINSKIAHFLQSML